MIARIRLDKVAVVRVQCTRTVPWEVGVASTTLIKSPTAWFNSRRDYGKSAGQSTFFTQ